MYNHSMADDSMVHENMESRSSIEFYDQLRDNDGPLTLKYMHHQHESKPKIDKCKFVFLTFFLYGLSAMLPWNIFNFSNDFFANTKLNTQISHGTVYQRNFMLINTIVWQLSFVLAIILNLIKCDRRFNQRNRIPFFLVLSALVMLALISLSVLESKNFSSGVILSSAFYSASILPRKYTNSILLGYSFSAFLTCTISIIVKSGKSPLNLAMFGIIFFVITIGVLLITLISHLSLSLSTFYRYHIELVKRMEMVDIELKNTRSVFLYYKTFTKIWPYLLSNFFLTFSTSIIYPFYQEKIKSNMNFSYLITSGWFTEITCHLFFSSMFFLGCLTAALLRWPGPRLVNIVVFFKSVLAIAFFMLCNHASYSRRHVPVYIKNDYIYSFGSIFFSYLTGHLVSLILIYTPKQVKPKYANLAAILSILTFSLGTFGGMQFSRVFELLILL